MAEIDDFLRHQLTPHMWPGEQVLFTAGVFPPTKQNEPHAIASTVYRSFVFECGTGFTGNPTPKAGASSICIEHSHLVSFIAPTVGLMGDRVLRFERPNAPVAAYQISSNLVRTDGQHEFSAAFIPWLEHHVQSGAFRSPQGMQHIAQEGQRLAAMRHAAHQHQEAYRAQAKAADDKKAVRWPLLMIIPMLLIALFTGFIAVRAVGLKERAADRESSARAQVEEVSKKPANKLQGDDGYALKYGKQWIEDAQDDQRMLEGRITTYGAITGACVVTMIGLVVLSIMLTSKKRARVAAAGPAR